MHGQFIWYELTTPDVDAAKKFYPRFTGWGTQPFDNDYTMWTTDGVPIGGLFQLSDEMRQLIMRNGNSLDIAQQAQREGVRNLRQSGLLKVKSGITSLEEIEAVTNE